MRHLILLTTGFTIFGCDVFQGASGSSSSSHMTPAPNSGVYAGSASDDVRDGMARTDVIALAQEAGEEMVEQCPNGGVLLNIEVAPNGNGEWDGDEVTGNKVVCHGRDGEAGSQGPQGDQGPQ